jgi:hypothetical protein
MMWNLGISEHATPKGLFEAAAIVDKLARVIADPV